MKNKKASNGHERANSLETKVSDSTNAPNVHNGTEDEHKKAKSLWGRVSRIVKNVPNNEEEAEKADIFEAELLPSYAKTYILPKKMRRTSFNIAENEGQEEEGSRSRKQSFARKQSTVTPEFQMSMLKASIEEKKISIPDCIDEDEDEKPPERPRKDSRKSLIPCNAAGGMREYAEFVKEGNFLPMSVLDPELGMDNEVFAEVKTTFGGFSRSGRDSQMSLNLGETVNLDEAFSKVTDMLNKVELGKAFQLYIKISKIGWIKNIKFLIKDILVTMKN